MKSVRQRKPIYRRRGTKKGGGRNFFLPISSANRGYNPEPLRLTVCGLPGALSVTCRVAEKGPTCRGVKVTLMMQNAPIANPVPPIGQLFVCAKLFELAPPRDIRLMIRGAVPVLVNVTGNGPAV